MKFKLTLVREFDDSDYFADSIVNAVGEIDDHIGNDEATSAVRDAFMTGFIDALDILDPEHTDWRVEVLDDSDADEVASTGQMSGMSLELFLESTAPANVFIGDEGDGDNIGWLVPLSAYATDQHDDAPKPHPPALDSKQITVWAAQLRMVAQQLDDLAQDMQKGGEK